MSTPTPPRLTGKVADDIQAVGKYMGDIYRSLIGESQLPQRWSRVAAILPGAIANPAPSGTKIIALTPVVLPSFTDPPTAAEMEALRTVVNANTAATLKILQAAQVQ